MRLYVPALRLLFSVHWRFEMYCYVLRGKASTFHETQVNEISSYWEAIEYIITAVNVLTTDQRGS